MSAYRKKRSESLTSESDYRAQKLNKAAGRFLEQQISKFEKEEKHLQRELLNLRRTRETLDAGMKLVMPRRPRSSSEPFHEFSGDLHRRNSGFSSHLNQKLPQIVPKSPIPPRRAATPEDPLQWYKATVNGEACSPGGQVNDASVKADKTCLLSVPDKQHLLRTYSNGHLNKFSEFKTNQKEVASPIQVFISRSPLESESNQDSSPAVEKDNEEADDVTVASGGNGRRRIRARSQGDIHSLPLHGLGCGDPTGSTPNPNLCVPSAPLSPKPRRGRLVIQQSSKTNIDLMHTIKLTGKFKAVGHTAVGVAVLNRLNVKMPVNESLDEVMIDEAGHRSPVPSPSQRRRGTLAHINLVSSNNPIDTRKQLKTCWSVKKDDASHADQVDTDASSPDKNQKIK